MRRIVLACLLTVACKREERSFHVPGAPEAPLTIAQASNFYAGEPPGAGAVFDPAMPGYAETAYNVSEGAAVYNNFNCVGCHANGGGAIGPAFIDKPWIYGSRPQDIATSILAGRPNGMPSFRGKIAPPQLYAVVAYVRSLGGLVRGDAVPARNDDIKSAPAGNLNNAGWPYAPKETP